MVFARGTQIIMAKEMLLSKFLVTRFFTVYCICISQSFLNSSPYAHYFNQASNQYFSISVCDVEESSRLMEGVLFSSLCMF